MVLPANTPGPASVRRHGFEPLLRLAAATLAVPTVVLLGAVEGRLHPVAAHGLAEDAAFPLAREVEQALRTAAGSTVSALGRGLLLGHLPSARGHAAAAIVARDSALLGVVLALADPTPDPFNPQDGDLLADLADTAAQLLPTFLPPVPAGCAVPMDAPDDRTVVDDPLEALPEAVAIFDEDDRFVRWNARFAELAGGAGEALRTGLRYEDHLRACLAAGLVREAVGREDAWLAERLTAFARCEGTREHQLGDGRWIRTQDRRLARGGKVGVRFDVTDLVSREVSFRLIFDANPAPMLVLRPGCHTLLAANAAALAFYGLTRETVPATTLDALCPDQQPGALDALLDEQGTPGSAFCDRLWPHRTVDGAERIVRMGLSALSFGGEAAVLATVVDLTAQHRLDQDRGRTRAFLRDVVDRIPVALFVKDMADEGRYVVYNRAGQKLLGRTADDLLGRSDADIFGADDAARFRTQDGAVLRAGASEEVNEFYRPEGTERWIRTRKVAFADAQDGAMRYILGLSEDVTEQRASDARIAHMAHHDALTGLPNRFLLQDRLEAALARLHGSSERLALLYLDLDGFKAVNDAFGHGIGDDLLCAVGDRLREAVRLHDTVARFGGDEFVVLQAPITATGEAAWLAGRLVSLLSQPFTIGGRQVRVGASVGVALAPEDAAGAQLLLEGADQALYEAKRAGRGRFRFAGGPPRSGDGTPRQPVQAAIEPTRGRDATSAALTL